MYVYKKLKINSKRVKDKLNWKWRKTFLTTPNRDHPA